MKRQILYFITIVLAVVNMDAAPALRGFFTVHQPDGTLLSVAQFGDEHHHWSETSDGILVINKGGAYYVAAIDDSGVLSPTSLLAHEVSLRDNVERQQAARQLLRKELFHQQRERALSRQMEISITTGYLPHKDSPHVLTILAAFQDSTFTVNHPVESFDQYLNGETQRDLGNKNHMNLSSVQQYFDICSHGLFKPQFDIVGPVVLPKELAYYGGSSETGGDDKFSEFCRDAIAQAKDLVPDWAKYDNDGDGRVELVCIIYAGYGQNQGGGVETIWAKASYQNIKIDDNFRVSFFNCSPEHFYPLASIDADGVAFKDYINGTGVFVHEMSHCLGLPDLYQTAGNYINNQTVESWDVMDYGLYNRNGFAPAAYTAWEREVMGWINIEPVTAPQYVSNLLPLDEGGKAYKIVNTADDSGNEFIVMESMVKRGLNSYAYGSGLLVYHVAYPYSDVNMTDSPNNVIGRPSVAVVPACGTFINSYLCGSGKQYTKAQWKESMAGSLFPGIYGVDTLITEMNLPNFLFYDNDSTMSVGYGLYDITETNDGISFEIKRSDSSTILPVMSPSSDSHSDCYDLLGRRLRRPSIHSRTLFIDGKTGKKHLRSN